jgi:hypothetical protein
MYPFARASEFDLYHASVRVMEAELAISRSQSDRIVARRRHRDLMRALVTHGGRQHDLNDIARQTFSDYAQEAEYLLFMEQ